MNRSEYRSAAYDIKITHWDEESQRPTISPESAEAVYALLVYCPGGAEQLAIAEWVRGCSREWISIGHGLVAATPVEPGDFTDDEIPPSVAAMVEPWFVSYDARPYSKHDFIEYDNLRALLHDVITRVQPDFDLE